MLFRSNLIVQVSQVDSVYVKVMFSGGLPLPPIGGAMRQLFPHTIPTTGVGFEGETMIMSFMGDDYSPVD